MLTLIPMLVMAPALPVLDLTCRLQPEQSKMSISASVTLVPAAQDTQKAIFFLSDRMEAPKVSVVFPERLKAREVSVKEINKNDHDLTYEAQLPGQLNKGEALTLQVEYGNKDSKGFVYLLDPQACFAGGYNTCWFPSVGDSRRMLGKLRFESPAGFIVKASGKEELANESNGLRRSTFQILQPTVPTFASARYKVTKVQGVIPMTVYLLKERPVAQVFADGCSKILGVLTKEFGKYPFSDFSIIETPAVQGLGFSGASFEGFMFADSHSVDQGFNLAYFGHEMGHQWWGNLIQRRGDKGDYILSEGLAQYGSLRCVTEIDGPAGAAKYRTTGYPSYSPMQSGYGATRYTGTPDDRPISNLPPGYDPVYHQLANSKGFLVWNTIARQMGRDRFARALKAVTSKYAWQAVSFDEALSELKAAGGGAPMDTILDQWFNRTGAPVVWSDWKEQGGAVTINLEQSEPAYLLTLPAVITLADGSSIVKELTTSSTRSTHAFPVRQRVLKVEVDPTFEVFHSTPELQKKAQALRYLTLGDFAAQRGRLEDAIPVWQKGLQELPGLDTFAVKFKLHCAIAYILRNVKRFPEAKTEYEKAFACPIRDGGALPYAYFNYARILNELGDRAGADEYLKVAEAGNAALSERTHLEREIAAFRSSRSK